MVAKPPQASYLKDITLHANCRLDTSHIVKMSGLKTEFIPSFFLLQIADMCHARTSLILVATSPRRVFLISLLEKLSNLVQVKAEDLLDKASKLSVIPAS
jgi:hypothetical protein